MAQEGSTERWIEIPEPVREIYQLWRPTPLVRARRLEIALDTPAHLYYNYEGGSPVGSHKPNSAVPQAFYNKQNKKAPKHSPHRRFMVNGAPPWQWHVISLIWRSKFIWSRAPITKSLLVGHSWRVMGHKYSLLLPIARALDSRSSPRHLTRSAPSGLRHQRHPVYRHDTHQELLDHKLRTSLKSKI